MKVLHNACLKTQAITKLYVTVGFKATVRNVMICVPLAGAAVSQGRRALRCAAMVPPRTC